MSSENLPFGFLTRSDTNWAVQPQQRARGLKFQNSVGILYLYVAKTKALISCTVTAFVLAYPKISVCNDVAHI